MRSRQVPFSLTLLAVCALVAVPFAAATTLIVDASNTTGVEDGTAAHPYRTMGRALSASFSGDVVEVRPGLYEENIGIPAGVIVMGQCSPAMPCDPNRICTRRRSDLDPNNPSIIDGRGFGSTVILSAVLSTTVLDGFTITGGQSSQGGGIAIFGNPIVCNNTISGNTALGGASFSSAGGGIQVTGNAIIQDNLIFSNTAVGGQGGGIAISGGAPTVTRNEIRGNSALADADGFSGYGGGVAVTAGVGLAAITSNIITGNRADQGGGGIDVYRSLPTIAGNRIEANRAGVPGREIGHGGGIAVTGQRSLAEATTPVIMNNLILSNEAAVTGGGIDVFFARPFLLSNNLFANTPVNFRGKQAPAFSDGNVSTDPNLPSSLSMPGPGFPHVDAGHPELIDDDEDLSPDPNVIGDRRLFRRASVGSLDFFHRPRALDGDQDGAGLSDLGVAELVPGSDPGRPGVDPNGIELDDLDGDGHLDFDPNSDNCPAIYNLAQIDSDADKVGDGCDNCPTRRNGGCDADPNDPGYDPAPDPLCDLDLNGAISDEERSTGRQLDTDNDGVGDPCDADLDNDGILEDFDSDGNLGGAVGTGACVGKQRVSCDDNCPDTFNDTQRDRDRDGVGDGCDNCAFQRNGFCDADPNAPGYDPLLDPFCDRNRNGIVTDAERAAGRQLDADGDSVGDACDNCPTVPNGNCVDGTSMCDIDGDGLLSGEEISRGGQADRDGDRTGDACEADLDNDRIPCSLVALTTIDPNAPAGRQIVTCDAPCVGGAVTGCDDNCSNLKNATQVDADSDGVGDTCDNCDTTRNGPCDEDADPNSPGRDPSKDPLCDVDLDGMVTVEEREAGRQLNTNGDAEGDICDTDDDGDGALDDGEVPPSGVVGDNPCPAPDPNAPATGCDDNCRVTANAAQDDTDDDGEGDACEDDADADGVLTGDPNGPAPLGDPDGDGIPTGDPNAPAPAGDPDGDGVPSDGNPFSPTARPCEAPFDPNEPCDDNCPVIANASQADVDEDGLGDACDDNCPTVSNTTQSDLDNDHLGDACDDNCATDSNPGQEDTDGDTFGDACDNCPALANIFQLNRDRFVDPNNEDTLGDDCDPDPDGDEDPNTPIVDNCPDLYNDAQTDADGDLVGDECDNCPKDSNPGQSDFDVDGRGDLCDQDDDADTIRDGQDNCPLVPNPLQANQDKDRGDDEGDACDADVEGDGVTDASDNCPGIYNPAQTDGDGDTIGDDCDRCPALASPVNTDGDHDGLGDPCDLPKLQATSIEGPATASLGGAPVPYTVTFTNLTPWNGTADYAIRLLDPARNPITPDLASVAGAPIPASGTIEVTVMATFPAGGPAGQWAVEAEVRATGSASFQRLRKPVTAN